MIPRTFQARALLLSVCANILFIAILVVWFISYKDAERIARSVAHTEAGARLHSGMLTLQQFKENQQKPAEDFIRDLRDAEARVFLESVNGLAWLDNMSAVDDESLVRLKSKLESAREFIAANPELFAAYSR